MGRRVTCTCHVLDALKVPPCLPILIQIQFLYMKYLYYTIIIRMLCEQYQLLDIGWEGGCVLGWERIYCVGTGILCETPVSNFVST